MLCLILPQFTAGMTLVNSIDSILMLYAYVPIERGNGDGRMALFQEAHVSETPDVERILVCDSIQDLPGIDSLSGSNAGERSPSPRHVPDSELDLQAKAMPAVMGMDQPSCNIQDQAACRATQFSVRGYSSVWR